MVEKSSVGDIIIDCIALRQRYEEKKPLYTRLLNLVTLVIMAALKRNAIKIHSMTYRLKDYNSFLEKIERKRYEDPFRQCTDLAGCRIICLFTSQVEEIKRIIEKEFEIIDITDKKTSKKFDQFGYLSLHMLLKVPKDRVKFTEYQDLSELICEVQIRTIVQEAWAEIEHYLNYKATKEGKDQELLRKIFSLAGMFEVADSTFEEIHTGFEKKIQERLIPEDDEITAVNLYKFSREYFPWYKNDWDKKEERTFLNLSNEAKRINLKSISEIRHVIDRHSQAIDEYENYHKRRDKTERYFSPVGLIRAALAIEYGKKFDMAFGLNGYADRVKKEINRGA